MYLEADRFRLPVCHLPEQVCFCLPAQQSCSSSLAPERLPLLHNYTVIRIGQNMVNDLRGALYAHL